MDSFPIELIENILQFCTGSQFSLSSRVSTIWWKAKQNIERTDHSFWRNRCQQEIQHNLIEELNPYHKPLDLLDSHQCKQLYIRWFRTQTIDKLPKEFFKCSETFGSTFSNFENVTALTVTGIWSTIAFSWSVKSVNGSSLFLFVFVGTLVITGHRSGKVHIIDVFNDMKPIEVTKHLESVSDLVAINLVGEG